MVFSVFFSGNEPIICKADAKKTHITSKFKTSWIRHSPRHRHEEDTLELVSNRMGSRRGEHQWGICTMPFHTADKILGTRIKVRAVIVAYKHWNRQIAFSVQRRKVLSCSQWGDGGTAVWLDKLFAFGSMFRLCLRLQHLNGTSEQ